MVVKLALNFVETRIPMTVAVDLFLRGHMPFKLNVATYDTIRYDNILLKSHFCTSNKIYKYTKSKTMNKTAHSMSYERL